MGYETRMDEGARLTGTGQHGLSVYGGVVASTTFNLLYRILICSMLLLGVFHVAPFFLGDVMSLWVADSILLPKRSAE